MRENDTGTSSELGQFFNRAVDWNIIKTRFPCQACSVSIKTILLNMKELAGTDPVSLIVGNEEIALQIKPQSVGSTVSIAVGNGFT